MQVFSLVLAGGTGERLGRVDKASIRLNGKTCLDHVLEVLAPQCDAIAISRAKTDGALAVGKAAVLTDAMEPQVGPLGGILAGAQWMARQVDRQRDAFLLVAPVDTPLFPIDFGRKASELISEKDVVIGKFGEDVYPVCGMWRLNAALAIDDFLRQTDSFAIRRFFDGFRVGTLDYAQVQPFNPFKNINKISDLLHFSAR